MRVDPEMRQIGCERRSMLFSKRYVSEKSGLMMMGLISYGWMEAGCWFVVVGGICGGTWEAS
jgi:hypothetical protein